MLFDEVTHSMVICNVKIISVAEQTCPKFWIPTSYFLTFIDLSPLSVHRIFEKVAKMTKLTL